MCIVIRLIADFYYPQIRASRLPRLAGVLRPLVNKPPPSENENKRLEKEYSNFLGFLLLKIMVMP